MLFPTAYNVNWSLFDFGRYLRCHLHGILQCQLQIASLWNRITIRVLIVSNSELLRCREILFSRLLSNRCLKHISSRISRWRLALSPCPLLDRNDSIVCCRFIMETEQLNDTTFVRTENWQMSWDLAESPRKITLTCFEIQKVPVGVS